MKNTVLLSLLALGVLTSSASAYYDDYKYKHHIKKGYQFGFNFGGGYTNKYKDNYAFSGIDSKYVQELGRSGINIGLSGALKYKTKHVIDTNPYVWDIEGRIGTDRFYKNLNSYAGVGLDGWKDIQTIYPTVGIDYYYSDDVILNFNYKQKIESFNSSTDTDSRFMFSVIIPFNHY